MRAASRPPSPTLPHKGEGSALWTWLFIAIAIALVAWLALVPLGFMLWQSVLSPQTATVAARFTLENYRTAYASADTARLLANSLQFAFGSALLAFSLGTLLAWINERTDTPFKSLFFALALVPLIIPGILFTVAWIFLGSPKIGIVNLVLQHLFSTDTVFINIYSIPGMIWVDGLHYSPMAFLLMTAAFRAMDPALEESALMSGATLPRILWRITIRLASSPTEQDRGNKPNRGAPRQTHRAARIRRRASTRARPRRSTCSCRTRSPPPGSRTPGASSATAHGWRGTPRRPPGGA